MQCQLLEQIIYEDERCALFIDGPNFYQTCRSLEEEIDYGLLRSLFVDAGYLVQARYYATILDDQDYTPIRPLIDWLSYNGFVVVTKTIKSGQGTDDRSRPDRGIRVELAVDAIEMSPRIDHAILFSGNGDFLHLLQLLQRRAVRTTVVGATSGASSMVSDELRRQADMHLDLRELMPFIRRKRHHLPALRQTG